MMQKEPRLRFTRIRKVKAPTRANEGDAGIDFYVPEDLNIDEFKKKQSMIVSVGSTNHIIETIHLMPGERVLIPSGIRVLIEPKNSMLQANNKSGVATKKGLVFTAQVVDSPYIGELHIGVVNTSKKTVYIKAGEKLMQFIHTPVFLTEPEEIPNELYDKIADQWDTTRGTQGFGSSNNK